MRHKKAGTMKNANQPKDKLEFTTAADVQRIMEKAASAWRESDLRAGTSLRYLIPLAEGMAALAREIQEIKSRLPPENASNGKRRRK